MSITIRPETAADTPLVEQLVWDTFGEAMLERAAWHLRQGVPFDPDLALVAHDHGALVGSVSCTPIDVGGDRVMMLGPLVVVPERKGEGIGKALMEACMRRAHELPVERTGGLVLLVGDYDYYRRFGFRRVPDRQIVLPKPVDYARVLAVELETGRLAQVRGMAGKLATRREVGGD